MDVSQIIEETPEEFLINIYLKNKKLSKSQIVSLNLPQMVEKIIHTEITLKNSTIILLSLSKLFTKSFIFLQNDCENFLKTLSISISHPKMLLKKHPLKPITLEILDPNVYVNDEMIERDEELLIPEEIIGDLTMGFENGIFEQEFPSIEVAREGTMISEILPITESVVKKRKIIEDRITEISRELYRSYLRSTADITIKPRIKDLIPPSRISIDRQILSLMEEEAKKITQEPEIQRFESAIFEQEAPFESMVEFPIEEKTMIAESESIFLNFEIPEDFVFNELISTFSKKSKAESFYDLLVRASTNEIKTIQSQPYSIILCTRM